MLFQDEADALKTSQWPRCDELAAALAKRGKSATDALVYASKSRVHHVRSACLRGLESINPDAAKKMANEFIKDKAYEVRETAAAILGVPVN